MRTRTLRMASGFTALVLALSMLFTPAAFALTRYSTLEFGSRGSDVLKLQKALLALGYDPSGTDGKYGRGTESAVIEYQASKGFTADGKAGTVTLNALYIDAAGTSSSTNTSSSSTTTRPRKP